MKIRDILFEMEKHVPLQLAEEWDNVGLLAGDYEAEVKNVLVTLDITPAVLDEAIESRVGLIVTHHPLPFRPLKKITTADLTGRLLVKALNNKIAIYSSHTAWDNSTNGINDQLSRLLKLESVEPLVPRNLADVDRTGSSRFGGLSRPATLSELFQRLQSGIAGIQPQANFDWQHEVQSVAICCGSGGSMLPMALRKRADALLTGEATYHQCLEAKAAGVALLMIGHHPSEQFAMKRLAEMLKQWLPALEVRHSVQDVNTITRDDKL